MMLDLEALHGLLQEKNFTVSSAESCTGGLVGAALTTLPGSSAYYLGGIVSYSNEVKMAALGVPEEVLRRVGAVSEETAIAMAEGVRRVIGSDYGLSTTGIAGPGGATDTKPVGLVYISVAGPKGTVVKELRLEGSREEVRSATVRDVLQLLAETIERDTI